MPSLVVVQGYNEGSRYPLQQDTIVMGRNAECDIVINVPAVSREHAKLQIINGKYHVVDLRSRNKTKLNGQFIEPNTPIALSDNDELIICDNVFAFHDQASKPPLPEGLLKSSLSDDEEEGRNVPTVEATINTQSSKQILETQPAEKLAFLLDVTAELTQSFELDEIFPGIINNLFQVFKQADRAFIILAEEGTDRLIPRITKTRRNNDDSPRFSRYIVRRCIDDGEAVLSEDATSDSRFSLSQSIADYRIRSVMAAPLKGRNGNKPFGVLQLDTQDRSKKFTTDDLKLLLAVAGQASIALENARMHQTVVERANLERDLELAHRVQLSFLPKNMPSTENYQFCAYYESAQQVGGDYYDFIPMQGNRIAAMIGDVAGKGIPAALLMAKVSSDARFTMLTENSPAESITKLNEFMQEAAKLDRFVTLETAVFDLKENKVTLVNAGHNAPFFYQAATGTFTEAFSKDFGGPPLGVVDMFPFDECTIDFQPGDALVMFSDGVTEATNSRGEEFQNERILEAVQNGPSNATALCERLAKAVKQFALGCPQHDDITIVCVSRNP